MHPNADSLTYHIKNSLVFMESLPWTTYFFIIYIENFYLRLTFKWFIFKEVKEIFDFLMNLRSCLKELIANQEILGFVIDFIFIFVNSLELCSFLWSN